MAAALVTATTRRLALAGAARGATARRAGAAAAYSTGPQVA